MLADKIFASIGMALFIGFVGIMLWRVHAPALWVVIILVTVLAIVDFWRDSRKPPELEHNNRP